MPELADSRALINIRQVGKIGPHAVYVFRKPGESRNRMGCLAQEVETIFPEAVMEIDGLKHVDYARLIQDVCVSHAVHSMLPEALELSSTRHPPVDMSPLERHQTIVLQISGGKDSTACLHLLRPFWDHIHVLWANAGATLPEIEEHMAKIARMVPHFEVVHGQQPASIAEFGWPTQVLPVAASAFGRQLEDGDRPLLQDYVHCCWRSWWLPMQRRTEELGATLVIRGQRNQERRKSPLRSGHLQAPGFRADGQLELWFPIQEWTEAQVWAYLKSVGAELPEYYRWTDHSLDCWSCTAFHDEAPGRLAYLRAKHPDKAAEVIRRFQAIHDQVAGEVATIDDILKGEPNGSGL